MFGLLTNGSPVIEPIERIIYTGNTGTNNGSIHLPNFDSDIGYFFDVPNTVTNQNNYLIPVLSWNNSSKILSWTFGSASGETEAGAASVVGSGGAVKVNSRYFLVHQAGGPRNVTGQGLIVADNQDRVLIDSTNKNIVGIRGDSLRFDTGTFSLVPGPGTRSATFADITDAVYSFIGRIYVGVYLNFATPTVQNFVSSSEYDSGNTFYVFRPYNGTYIGPSYSGTSALLIPPIKTTGDTYGADRFAITTRRQIVGTDNEPGLVVNDSQGDVVYYSEDGHTRAVGDYTYTNAQNLGINSHIDFSHGATDNVAYNMTASFSGYIKTSGSIYSRRYYILGVEPINSTTSRLAWREIAFGITSRLNSQGQGIPDNASSGAFDVHITVVDVSNATVPKPSFPSNTLNITANVGFSVSQNIGASAIDGVFSVSPALPPGLSLSQSGVISGVATAAIPSQNFVVTVSNAGGSATRIVRISGGFIVPNISTPSQIIAIEQEQSISLQLSASGSPATWSVSPALPAGLSLSSSGLLSGNPPNVLTPARQFTFTASNGGGSDSVNIFIEVTEAEEVETFGAISTTNFDNIVIDAVGNVATGSLTTFSFGDITISATGSISVVGDVTISSFGDITLNADGDITVSSGLNIYSFGNINITSDNGDVIVSGSAVNFSFGEIDVSAPNGNIRIGGVNYGSSFSG